MLVVPTAASWIGTGQPRAPRSADPDLPAVTAVAGPVAQARIGCSSHRPAVPLAPIRRFCGATWRCGWRAAKDEWTTQANLFTLLFAATSGNDQLPWPPAAQALTQLGWATQEVRSSYDLMRLPAVTMVRTVTDGTDHRAAGARSGSVRPRRPWPARR